MKQRYLGVGGAAFSALLLALTASCVGGGVGGTSHGTGGSRSSTGGATESAGVAGDANTAGSVNTGGTRAVGQPDPPPAPPKSDVPQPIVAVTSPNLRVLTWAGFAAAITYTFDDTQPSQTEHWPELKATGARMTFFANPSGSWQSGYDAHWSAVAAAGSEIGNHTWNHCRADLSSCTTNLGSAGDELDKTTAYITSHFGVPEVYTFASPYGDSAWNAYAAPRFLVGRGVVGGTVPATGMADWYNLPVFAVAAGQTATNFNASIDAARTLGRWGIFMYHSILPTSNNWYAGVEVADIVASVTYAQSLGDVWLDTFAAIGAYARAQQVFEQLVPSGNTWRWTLPAHFPPGKVLRVEVDGGTLSQSGSQLTWDPHGYYEVALDVGALSWAP